MPIDHAQEMAPVVITKPAEKFAGNQVNQHTVSDFLTTPNGAALPAFVQVQVESLQALRDLMQDQRWLEAKARGQKFRIQTKAQDVKEYLRLIGVTAVSGDDKELRAEVARTAHEEPGKKKLVRLAAPEEYAKMAKTAPEKLAAYRKTLADLDGQIILRNQRGDFIAKSDYPMLFDTTKKDLTTPVKQEDAWGNSLAKQEELLRMATTEMPHVIHLAKLRGLLDPKHDDKLTSLAQLLIKYSDPMKFYIPDGQQQPEVRQALSARMIQIRRQQKSVEEARKLGGGLEVTFEGLVFRVDDKTQRDALIGSLQTVGGLERIKARFYKRLQEKDPQTAGVNFQEFLSGKRAMDWRQYK